MIDRLLRGKGWREVLQQADDGAGGGGPADPPAGEALPEEEMQTVYVDGVDEIPEEEPQIDPQEIQRQNQELQAQLESLRQQADVGQNLQQSISQLGETLQQPRRTGGESQGQAVPQQQPGESEEEFAQRLRDNFYDDPYKLLNEFQYRKLQPFVAQMVNNNLANSKRFLQVDPEKKGMYQRYGDEIEAEIQGMAYQEKMTDPQVYDKAYERVMARHMDDIIEAKIQERMAQKEAESAGGNGRGQQSPPPTSSEQSSYRPAGKANKPIKKLTRQEAAAADAKGIPYDHYYNWLVEHGMK